MENNKQTVSVVITTRNRAQLLPRAIQSVLTQTYKSIELIIVDDASEDDTVKAVASFTDPRIIYIRQSQRKGGSASRNTGIKTAAGEFIAFLDDDDEWLPEKLFKQLNLFDGLEKTLGIVYCAASWIDNKTGRTKKILPAKIRGDLRHDFLLGSGIGSVSKVLAKKECLIRAGLFDENLTSCQDWDMWKRIADLGYTFDYVPEILVNIYSHANQISTNWQALIEGRESFFYKHQTDLQKQTSIYLTHIKQLGKIHCLNGTFQQAYQWFKIAIGIKKSEAIKIMAWLVIEYPWLRLFSRFKDFKIYRKK